MKSKIFSTVVTALSWIFTLGIDAQTSQPLPSAANTPSPTEVTASRSSPDSAPGGPIQDRVLVRSSDTNTLQSVMTYSESDTNKPSDSAALQTRPVYNSGLLGALTQPSSRTLIKPFDITAPLPRRDKVRGGQPWTGSYGGTPPILSIQQSAIWAELEGINVFTLHW